MIYMQQNLELLNSTPAQRALVGCEASELIAVAFLFALTLGSLDTNLLVILLESRQVFTGLTELTFFHTLSDIPMHESTLAVHEIELVVDAGEDFGNGCGIADHAAGTHDLGQVTTWDHSWWLVIDTTLEASGRPVDKLDGALGLNGCD